MAKKITKAYMDIGGKRYVRGLNIFGRKSDVQKHAIRQRKFLNNYAVIDKNSKGWFVWLKSKPKKPIKKKIPVKKNIKERKYWEYDISGDPDGEIDFSGEIKD